ncbi:sulfurase [Albimonas sp. CAU 1670]|uniref:MOSC domain-containing protein n=1 Tax=Albimonas sp. CAU 1670 TaxID=3032599 RepID=UPI0023DCB715|nr:sulfurase [Albimonas sp. CAU 1670]MDF2233284.1 sulfurase [Albimonas sp. CAU 1670]
MPILTPTDFTAEIVYLGIVPDREAGLVSTPLERVDVEWEGFAGECHGGLTRPSCSRVTSQYPRKGTEIRNVRQLSILSDEELAGIAADIGLERLPPQWVGANLVLKGIEGFTDVPPSSRLIAEGGVSLTVDMENAPCQLPARVIEDLAPGHGKRFKAAALHRRGVTGWVERPGALALGERMRLHVPPPVKRRWI